jgi:alpha-tubulin suppressor-like RCC1 family protein
VKIDSGPWSTVVAGELTACGLRGAELWCWGDNGAGQLGDGTIIARQVPSQTLMQQPTAKLAVGAKHTCNVDAGGRLWCWGANGERQLIAATPPASAVPLNLSIVGPVTALAAYEHTCAIAPDTYAYCWGRNTTGQLGRGMVTALEAMPVAVVESSMVRIPFATLTAGLGHSCGITTSTLVYCWGRNNEGQLGNNTMQTTAFATYLGFAAAQIDAGSYHTCAIAGGELHCWGGNSYGQIGDGTASFSRPAPRSITGTWTEISAGAAHTCGLQVGGELWCWGENSRGTLGDGTRTNRSAPVRIGSATWSTVSSGSQFTCGVRTDGSLWCWGANVWGQLGDNTAWSTRFVQIGMP